MSKVGMGALALVLAGAAILPARGAEEKPKKAKEVVDRVRQADPPKAEKSTKTVDDKVAEARRQQAAQDKANAHNSGRKTDLQTPAPPAPKK